MVGDLKRVSWLIKLLLLVCAATNAAIKLFRDFGTGVLFAIDYVNHVHNISGGTYTLVAPTGSMNVSDVCYAAPSTPAEPVDPTDPGYHYTYRTIGFDIIASPPVINGYTYRTIYFTINAIAPNPVIPGYCFRTIYYNVYAPGDKIETDSKLMVFDIDDGIDNVGLIEFNITGPIEKDYIITFYINETFNAIGIPMTSKETTGGTLTAGNKSIMVKIYQAGTLVATANDFLKVSANAGIWVDIKGIPFYTGSTMLVEGYVKNALVYSQTVAYKANWGVQLI